MSYETSYQTKKTKQGKIFDTPHKNEFNYMSIMPALDNRSQDKVILDNVKRKKATIYGSTAFNSQVPLTWLQKRPKGDIDIMAKQPKQFALLTERRLDTNVGMNNYFVSELIHPKGKTYRVHSRATNRVVADISKPKKTPTKMLGGIKFETIGSREKTVKKLLKDPKASYRRKKDEKMLGVIKRYKKSKSSQLNPFGDFDKDGIKNWQDCAPRDKNRQGKTHDYFRGIKEAKAEKALSRSQQSEKSTNVFTKMTDGKWYFIGKYTTEGIEVLVEDLSTAKGVVQVQLSQDSKFADKENRKLMAQQVGRGAKTLGKGAVGGTVGVVKAVAQVPEGQLYVESRQFGKTFQESVQQRRPVQQPKPQPQAQPRQRYEPTQREQYDAEPIEETQWQKTRRRSMAWRGVGIPERKPMFRPPTVGMQSGSQLFHPPVFRPHWMR